MMGGRARGGGGGGGNKQRQRRDPFADFGMMGFGDDDFFGGSGFGG